MPTELKPCKYCGANWRYISTTISYVEISCACCGATVKEYGKKASYKSIAACKRYVMPKAVTAWNRRAGDAD